jgi:hypothetical protein
MSRRMPAGAALALVLALSGCGSSSSGTGIATAPTTTASAATGSTSSAQPSTRPSARSGIGYAQCMRKHGIDMPDPTSKGLLLNQGAGSAPTADQRKLDAAMSACKALLPSGGQLVKPPADAVASLRKMAKCMRDNGITKFPDPGANGQLLIDKSSGIDPTSAAFKAAQTKCAKFAPAGIHQQGPGPVGGSK